MIKFAQIQDVHLGYHQYGLKQRADDFASAWLWSCHEIVERGCQFVILCGDLFNQRDIKPQTYLEAVYGLKILHSEGVNVYAIEGNHEQMRDGTRGWMSTLWMEGHLTWLEGLPEYYRPFTILGVNWAKGNTAKYLENRVLSKEHILILHAAYEPMVSFTVPELVTREQLQNLGAGYIGIGHIHSTIDDGVVHSCGSTETWSATEIPFKDRGFNVVTYDGEYHVERVVTPKRGFAVLDIAVDGMTKQQLLNEIGDALLQHNTSFKEWITILNIESPDLGLGEREIQDLAREFITPLHIKVNLNTLKDTTIRDSITEDVALFVEQTNTASETWNKVVAELANKTYTPD